MQLLRFKCKKCSNNWKYLKNVAFIKVCDKCYKSNVVTTYNACYGKKYKLKISFAYEDCNNIYKVKMIKIFNHGKTYFKIYIKICSKHCNKSFKFKYKTSN